MKKINDPVLLGAIAGLSGNAAKMILDQIFVSTGQQQRPFRTVASGVWLPSRKEAETLTGNLLGTLLDFGMGLLGGIGIINVLSNSGTNYMLPKGVLYGLVYGSTITAMLSALPINKIRPQDAGSNVCYIFEHGAYGLVATVVAATLADPALLPQKPAVVPNAFKKLKNLVSTA